MMMYCDKPVLILLSATRKKKKKEGEGEGKKQKQNNYYLVCIYDGRNAIKGNVAAQSDRKVIG